MIKITTTLTITKVRARRSQPCVYFFHEGESIVHNLVWRRCRPLQWYFDLLPTILRHAGMIVTEDEAGDAAPLGRWDQLAACRCGCSPGIVLERPGLHDLYVTIGLESVVIEAGDTSATPM